MKSHYMEIVVARRAALTTAVAKRLTKETFTSITAAIELFNISLGSKIGKLNKAAKYIKTNGWSAELTTVNVLLEATAKWF